MKLTYEQRDVLLNMKDGKWYHPADLGNYTTERFFLRDRGLVESSEVMQNVVNYRITPAGREALDNHE